MELLAIGVSEIGTLTGFLVENGAWAITAIAMMALAKVYRDKLIEQKDMGILLENRHNEFVELLKENAKLFATLINLIQKCKKGDPDA